MRADSSRPAPPHFSSTAARAWVPLLARLLSGGVGAGTGFAGTYDSMHYPPSEALAVGLHPTDDGEQQQQREKARPAAQAGRNITVPEQASSSQVSVC